MTWSAIQSKIGACSDCSHLWPGEVCRPLMPGEIPDPPSRVRLLFVGVAPTPEQGPDSGGHFYTSTSDKLRAGLFRLLAKPPFDVQLTGLDLRRGNVAFFDASFFFVHAAKVRPVSASSPPKACVRFCAAKHLREEILALRPSAICFLGKGNATPAAKELFGDGVGADPLEVALEDWRGLVAVASQPVRGHEATTRTIVERLDHLLRREDL